MSPESLSTTRDRRVELAQSVSGTERDRRHREVRAAMDAAGIDILLAVSIEVHKGDVRYITNHNIWSQIRGYAVLTKDTGPFLVLAIASEDYWARLNSWALDVRWSLTPIRDVIAVVKSLATTGQTLGVSGLNDLMPKSDYEQLKAELAGLSIRDATDLLQTVRSRKSNEEIALIRQSADIASAGFATLKECAGPGVAEFEIVGEVERVVRGRGAEMTKLLTSQGPYLRNPSGRTLQRGDFQLFHIEMCGPSGYWVELGGMLAIGDIDDTAASVYQACQRVFAAGLHALKVGSTWADVGRALRTAIEESGHKAGIWGGHGIGLDIVESPRLVAADDTIITEGMTFGFHPHVIESVGPRGASIANTVTITAKGPIELGQFGDTGSLIVVK